MYENFKITAWNLKQSKQHARCESDIDHIFFWEMVFKWTIFIEEISETVSPKVQISADQILIQIGGHVFMFQKNCTHSMDKLWKLKMPFTSLLLSSMIFERFFYLFFQI